MAVEAAHFRDNVVAADEVFGDVGRVAHVADRTDEECLARLTLIVVAYHLDDVGQAGPAVPADYLVAGKVHELDVRASHLLGDGAETVCVTNIITIR